MRSRALLHRTKLEEFSQWLQENGWELEATVGSYEALRARHYQHREPILIYYRLSGDHYTTHGISLRMVTKYLREKNYDNQNKVA